MTASVFAADEQGDRPVDTRRWLRLAEKVLDAEGVDSDTEVSLLFVDRATISGLHKRFLGEDGPTDVLSFPLDEEKSESGRSPDAGGSGPGSGDEGATDQPILLGDVVICPDVAHANAPQHAGTYEDELALLVVHGLLHLLGMDHEDDEEAEEMEGRERELLARFYRSTTGGGGAR